MPLSKITAASMADLGYVVNLNAADPYSPPSNLQGPGGGSGGSGGAPPRILRPLHAPPKQVTGTLHLNRIITLTAQDRAPDPSAVTTLVSDEGIDRPLLRRRQ